MEIELTPFEESDLGYLFANAGAYKSPFLREPASFAGAAEFEAYFLDRLERAFHVFYMARDGEGVFGFVYTRDYRIYDANCRMHLFAKRRHGELLRLFAARLYRSYPLHRIYCWARQDDGPLIAAARLLAPEPDAVLREYLYAGGSYLDVSVWGITREACRDEE